MERAEKDYQQLVRCAGVKEKAMSHPRVTVEVLVLHASEYWPYTSTDHSRLFVYQVEIEAVMLQEAATVNRGT